MVDIDIEVARAERCTLGQVQAGTCETKLKSGVRTGWACPKSKVEKGLSKV